MSGQQDLKYQLRLVLSDVFAQVARSNPADPALKPVTDILQRHNATLKCQFDAFDGYVREAEASGNTADYPLYDWTKQTLADPAKEAKYKQVFTVYVGGAEVYERDVTDKLHAELVPLAGQGIVTRIQRTDTNPANNPQPPRQG